MEKAEFSRLVGLTVGAETFGKQFGGSLLHLDSANFAQTFHPARNLEGQLLILGQGSLRSCLGGNSCTYVHAVAPNVVEGPVGSDDARDDGPRVDAHPQLELLEAEPVDAVQGVHQARGELNHAEQVHLLLAHHQLPLVADLVQAQQVAVRATRQAAAELAQLPVQDLLARLLLRLLLGVELRHGAVPGACQMAGPQTRRGHIGASFKNIG